jgi:hypothetical protein
MTNNWSTIAIYASLLPVKEASKKFLNEKSGKKK